MNQIQHHIGAWKQEIYWRHKGGIQKIEKTVGLCFMLRSWDDMLIFPCWPGRLLQDLQFWGSNYHMDPADQPCPARDTPSTPTVLTWLQVCRKNPVDLSETPRLGWWQLWKVQHVRGLVRSEVIVEELSMGEAAEGRWWQLDMTDGSQRIILWSLSSAPWETRWFHWILCL